MTGSPGRAGIGEEARAAAVEVIRRFKAIAEAQRADEIVALGTAAIREALDGSDFVDRVRDEIGCPIEVVDGAQRSRADLHRRPLERAHRSRPRPRRRPRWWQPRARSSATARDRLRDERAARRRAADGGASRTIRRATRSCSGCDPGSPKCSSRALDEIHARKPAPADRLVGDLRCPRADGGRPARRRRPRLGQPAVGRTGRARHARRRRSFGCRSTERAKLPGAEPRRSELLPAGCGGARLPAHRRPGSTK